MKIAKKPISLLLSVLMVFSVLMNMNVFAENTNEKIVSAVIKSDGVSENGGYKISNNQYVMYEVNVPKNAKYNIALKYLPIEVRNETVNYTLYIDGKIPFTACSELKLPVNFISKEKSFVVDADGNQNASDLILDSKEITSYIKDSQGLIYGPYNFELTAGKHTVKIFVTDGFVELNSLIVESSKETVSYKDYLSSHNDKKSGSGNVIIEAETPFERTSKAVSEFCDYSSASVYPEAENLQVLNAIGGSQWKVVGQDVSYKFSVKESGFYNIAVKYRQNYTNGRASFRGVLIDGELPFDESAKVEFPYTGSWTVKELGDKEPYKYWLEKGEHTVTFQVSLGNMNTIIEAVRDVLSRVNAVYRKIVAITGTDPDAYRDYQLDEKIPDTIKEMADLSKRINEISSNLKAMAAKSSESGALDRLAIQLDTMSKYPEKCAMNLSQFQSNISTLGTWINDRFNQPLAIDNIEITAEKTTLKTSGFFASFAHSVRQFIYSFSDDYNTENGKKENIDVWALTGRDQVQIIKHLINESFEANNDISVDLKLVSETAILPATAAGQGPDVCLMLPQTTPINFAIRDSVVDLSQFDGFNDVIKRFIDQSVVSFKFDNKFYALPETMTFPMLFYRKDILDELGLSVPKTWDDVRELIVDLSNNNMQFGFTGAEQNYLTMLYQKGGLLYREDGKRCLLDSNDALETFEEYVALYHDYCIPVTFDFANRFRSGMMPVAITDYAQYNTLQIFASEISGLWDIAPVPSTSIDGKEKGDVACTVTGCVIFSDAKSKEACWKFLEWWTRADIQEKYGRRVEEKLGASARYATANKETLKQLPWSISFYNSLSEQMQNVKGVPQIPGSYFTSRHFNNAFRKSVYKSGNPRETLIEYTQVINDEINTKRQEFNLPILEEEE